MCKPYYDWNNWQTFRAQRWIDNEEWIKNRLERMAYHLSDPFPKPLTPVIASQLTEELAGEIRELVERKTDRLEKCEELLFDLLREALGKIDYLQLAEKFMKPYFHPLD